MCGGFGDKMSFQHVRSDTIYLHSWVTRLLEDPGTFNRKARKFCNSHFANITVQREPLANANIVVGFVPFRCPLCTKVEPTLQQFRMHLFKKHGLKDSIRLHVQGSRCLICLKEFHQRENLLNHLKKVGFCYRQYKLLPKVFTSNEADELEASLRPLYRERAHAGFRRHHLSQRCRPGRGPRRPVRYGPVPLF